MSPEIFPVSARLALRAKQGDPSAWAASRFEALERYIRETLDSPGRVHLKLLNPLGVGAALTERHATVVRDRAALLKEDFATLDEVERQLEVFQQDRMRDFGFRIADIDNILLEMERRGQAYFDETMRIGRVMDLLNRSRMQQGFEQEVVADAPQQIERKVGELVDWLVDADLRQWQDVTKHLAQRKRQYQDRIVGDEDAGRFHYDRTRLIDSVGRESQRVVDSYDRRKEARELADGARNAVAAAAAVSAGALGLGTIVDDGGDDGGGRRDRHRHGIGRRGARVLHPAREARARKGGDAPEDRRRPAAAVRGAARAVRAGDRQERRPHPGEHRAVQPLHPRGRREAPDDRAGAARDRRGARHPARAHRPESGVGISSQLPASSFRPSC